MADSELFPPPLIPERVPNHFAAVGKMVLYAGAYFEAVLVACVVLFFCISQMRSHFANLLWRSWKAFVDSQGSTTLGWVSSTIIVPILAVAVTVFLIRQRRGKEAMLTHWRQDAVITLRVIVFVVLFYYGPLFLWKGIIRTIYDDHQLLVAQRQSLAADNQQLIHRPPEIQTKYLPSEEPKESPKSLRRRTLKLADELYAFLRNRFEHHPPYATRPGKNESQPDEARLKIIEASENYDQATEDMYIQKGYRDRLTGIIREYDAKGIPTDHMENGFKQHSPYFVSEDSGWADTPQDPLFWFKSLAYRVDANDNAIHLEQ